MSRLVTFGCSHTYGHALPDCIIEYGLPGFYPSKFSWPFVLAQKANLDLVNLGMAGCSNFAILDKIINFKLDKTDRVIVLWSYFERDMLFRTNGTRYHFRIGKPNSFYILGKKPIDYWGEIHNPIDIRMRTWYYMHHAFTYLTHTVANFNFYLVNRDKEFFELQPGFNIPIDLTTISFEDYLEKYPRGVDNAHGGVECHKAFAQTLYEELFVNKNI